MAAGDYLSVLSHGLLVTEGSGESDPPAESDVRLGVNYENGSMTGTLRVPLESQVRYGVVFDANDSLTGTYGGPPPDTDEDDYHGICRDAVRDTIEASSGLASENFRIRGLDDIEDAERVDTPCVVCVPVGPEIRREDLSTNSSDGIGYPVLVALMTSGVTSGEKQVGVPDMTLFRRVMVNLFHHKRLLGDNFPTPGRMAGWCEIEPRTPIFDKNLPVFQKLSTAVVVNCYGRWPRG